MIDIPVTIADRTGAQVNARIITFQTISRIYPANQESNQDIKQEGIIFGICLTEDGQFLARRLHEMKAISEAKDAAS